MRNKRRFHDFPQKKGETKATAAGRRRDIVSRNVKVKMWKKVEIGKNIKKRAD